MAPIASILAAKHTVSYGIGKQEDSSSRILGYIVAKALDLQDNVHNLM
jgi:hypothetical protein